ncbi:leucine-rich repeat and death domain-containing protein 1 isoform X4 [Monodelphis domestica]|uniref:leucine-rich repeat and death domain-containing protein 1 isoform X4 n=1 Tax=Monodelphis domestica TaxID=13616 RepID=UPI0024E220F6|nr:leucine-rich repeat and death domain-containing protein 1 isoform X4 [Monodelphis domestica]
MTRFPEQCVWTQQNSVRTSPSNELNQVSEELTNLIHLKILDISHNNIKEIPKNIGELKRLATFNASNNLIHILPPSFGSLNKLQQLDMSENRLTTLPTNLSSLPSLKEINFDGNPLIRPPPEVCRGKDLNVIGHYLEKADDRDEKILLKIFKMISQNLNKGDFEFFCEKLQLKKPVIEVLLKKTATKLPEAILEALNIWKVEKDPPLTAAVLRDQLIRIIALTGILELSDRATALKLSTRAFKF